MVYKKTPKVGTLQEFHEIDVYNKRNHKIQYFFKETIPKYFSYKKFYFEQKLWEFKHKYIPKYNYSKCPTGLDPTQYYDIPELMLHVNFKFLERFVEQEECFETINWDSDKYHACVASEIEDLYWWWKNERPKRDLIIDFLYEATDDVHWLESTDKNLKIYKELNRLETFWDLEDTYNLKRLMHIRMYLWT